MATPTTPVLTPEQEAVIDFATKKYGRAVGDGTRQRMLLEQPASVAPAMNIPVAPKPPKADAPPADIHTPYLGYAGVKPLKPLGAISGVSDYTLPSDVSFEEDRAFRSLQQEYIDQYNLTPDQAASQAAGKIRSLRKARDMSYQQRAVPFQATPGAVIGENVFGMAAIGESLKPQIHVTPEQARESKSYEAQNAQTRQNFSVQATQAVDKEKAAHPYWTKVDYENARNQKLRDIVAPHKPTLTGDAAKDAEKKEQYRKWVGAVAPTLLSDPEFKTTLGEMVTKSYTDTAKKLLTQTDPATGAISESLLGAGLRDLGALWRPVITPLRNLATYEVDSEGHPLDTTDVAYQFHEATGFGENVTASPLPAIGSARQVTPEGAATGLWLTDIAKDIRDGAWVGSDLASLPTYQKKFTDAGIPNAPLWIGFAAELALPATPLSALSKPVSALKTAVGVGVAGKVAREATKGLEVTVDLSKAADEASILNTAARHIATETVEPIVTLNRVSRGASEFVHPSELENLTKSQTVQKAVAQATNAGGVNRATLVSGLTDQLASVRAQQKAGTLAPEVSKALDEADSMVSRFSPTSDTATKLVTNDIQSANYAKALVNRVEASGESINKQSTLSEFVQKHTPTPENMGLLSDTITDVVTNNTKEALRNKLPADLMLLTPTVVVKRSAWDKISKSVVKETQEFMAGSHEGNLWFAKNPTTTSDQLLSALGPGRADSPGWRSVVSKLDNGEGLTTKEYMAVYNEVLGDLAISAGQAQGLTFTGKAATSAAVPKVAQMPLRGVFGGGLVEGMGSGVVQALQKNRLGRLFTGTPATEASRSPLVVKNFIGQMQGEVAHIPDAFRADLKTAQKQGGVEAGFQKTIDDSFQAAGVSQERSWQIVLGKFFGARVPDHAEIAERTAGMRLTPANMQAVIDQIRAEHQGLKEVGLRSPIPGVNTDNLFAALTTSAIEARASRVVLDGYTQLMQENPHLALPTDAVMHHMAGQLPDVLRPHLRPIPQGVPQAATTAGADVATLSKTADQAARRLSEDTATLNELRDMGAGSREIAIAEAAVQQSGAEARASADALRNARVALRSQPAPIAGPAQTSAVATQAAIRDLTALAAEVDKRSRRPVAETILRNVVTRGSEDILAGVQPVSRAEVDAILTKHGFETGWSDDIVRDMTAVIYQPLGDAIVNQVRSWGLHTDVSATEAVASMRPYLTGVSGSELITLFGKDLGEELGKLKNSTQMGALADSLESMRIKDKGMLQYLWDLIPQALQGQRRVQTAGLLAGFPLPNPKYHGVNFLTAPLIIATTTDIPTALKSTLEVGRSSVVRLFDVASARMGKPSSAVVLSDANGKQWTLQMLDDAVARNNISTSQQGFEFSETLIHQIARQAELSPQATKVGMARTAARWMDPSGKNYAAEIADWSDNMWRRNVFVTALREGLPEAQAADIARKSLLDYGAVDSAEKAFAARYLLVYSFRKEIAKQTLLGIIRNPNDMSRLIRAGMHQQQIAGTWLNSDDSTMDALWTSVGPTYDDQETINAGPSNPPVAAVRDMLSALEYPLQGATGAEPWGKVISTGTEALVGQVGQPIIDYVLSVRQGVEAGDGGMVPPEQVALLMETGTWPTFAKTFHVETVTEKRKAGTPTFEGVQYRFADQTGMNLYLATMTGLMMAGLKRTMTDYQKIAMSTGAMTPEGMDAKRYGVSTSPVAQAFGVSTPRQVPDALRQREFQIKKQIAELKALQTGK